LAALTRDPKAIAFARARTAWTLGRLGEAAAGAVPELVRALKAAEPEVREAAMEALRDLGPGAKAAVDVLAVKLSDEDLASRLSAAEILRGLGPHAERAIPELAKAVQNPEQDPKVRRLAAETLGSMGAAA